MLTVGITNYNYGRYLARAIESALGADRIIVVDDCSTDDSLEIARGYDVEILTHTKNSGSAVKGYNELIESVDEGKLVLLSADDYLLPDALGFFANSRADWTFGDVLVVDEDDNIIEPWTYSGWPTEPIAALAKGFRDLSLPVTMLAAFDMGWIHRHGLRFKNFEHTTTAADTRTGIEWLRTLPSIVRIPQPLFAYRRHPGQETDALNCEREVMQSDLVALYMDLFDHATLSLFQDI